MSSWAKRRRTIYVTTITIIVFGIIGVPVFLLLYKAPTCFDGVKNGDERNIDCGGSCQKLCQDEFLSPIVGQPRFEELAPRLYNIATYIINPNIDGEAKNVPYHMYIYDAKGMLIKQIDGKVTLPPHRNTLAYQSAINVGERTPARVAFEFADVPNWERKDDTLSPLMVIDKKYTEDDFGSSLSVTLKNNSVRPIPKTSVYAVLYDKDGVAIGFSKTYIDDISPEKTVVAPFTWPVNRHDSVISIEVLPVAE